MSKRTLPAARIALGVGVAVGIRVAYAWAEPRSNPFFAEPGLDASYYLDWARSLSSGASGPGGAFYLAPLYAYLLCGLLAVLGERILGVVLLQQAIGLAACGTLALTARHLGGRSAGWWTFLLAAFHQPLIFFCARTTGESIGVLLLVAATALAARGLGALSGALAGAAALARPNLLLLPALWSTSEVIRRRSSSALLVAAGAAAIVAPVTVRNWIVSGHPVLVSSNGGLTLYHGNGPGSLGVYNPPDGFSGALATQRAEARELARFRSGRDLDAVEADRWWGREAVRERLRDPWGTLVLSVRKLFLSIDSYEHGLDEAPALDENPWRPTWRWPGGAGSRRGEVPLVAFGALLGLAAAGVILRGFGATGGGAVWGAAAVCAFPLLAFYVSSRYRLPLAMILAIPAGIGAASITTRQAANGARRRAAAAVAATILAVSLLLPFGDLKAAEEAGALANRASAWKHRGELDRAEMAARAAVARDPGVARARFALAVVLSATGRATEAELEYRAALGLDPGHAESAANLAVLLAESGRVGEGISILRAALTHRPTDAACWTNLVIAYASSGDLSGSRAAAANAARAGVSLEAGLLQAIGMGTQR